MLRKRSEIPKKDLYRFDYKSTEISVSSREIHNEVYLIFFSLFRSELLRVLKREDECL